MNGLALRPTWKQFIHAHRLIGMASLDSVRLIHVRAADMTADSCPVKNAEEKPMPTTTAVLIPNTNCFRVVFGHVVHAKRETTGGGTEIQVDASFELRYSYPPDTQPVPTSDELQAFADTNALMNCWPYWRELVQTTVTRMNLPPIIVPVLRFVPPPPPEKKLDDDVTKKLEGASTAGV
jgi:hypothetical protein